MPPDDELNEIFKKRMLDMLKSYYIEDETHNSKYIFKVSERDFNEKVIKQSYKKPVIVDFWAPWCRPCHSLAHELYKVIKFFKGKVLLVKINVDENIEISNRYNVLSIPTIMIFQDGKVKDYLVGLHPKEEIIKWIEKNII